MPVTHLLDTSVYSQPISKQPHAQVVKRWQALGDTALVTSAICETRGVPVADMDLLIAATAKAHNLVVATLNTNDFHAIQGITVEDWSQPLPL
jgi:predicted nucleic acid-binding protein